MCLLVRLHSTTMENPESSAVSAVGLFPMLGSTMPPETLPHSAIFRRTLNYSAAVCRRVNSIAGANYDNVPPFLPSGYFQCWGQLCHQKLCFILPFSAALNIILPQCAVGLFPLLGHNMTSHILPFTCAVCAVGLFPLLGQTMTSDILPFTCAICAVRFIPLLGQTMN